jgi:hypothetical protein
MSARTRQNKLHITREAKHTVDGVQHLTKCSSVRSKPVSDMDHLAPPGNPAFTAFPVLPRFDVPSSTLLDTRYVELQQLVEPVKKFLPVREETPVSIAKEISVAMGSGWEAAYRDSPMVIDALEVFRGVGLRGGEVLLGGRREVRCRKWLVVRDGGWGC